MKNQIETCKQKFLKNSSHPLKRRGITNTPLALLKNVLSNNGYPQKIKLQIMLQTS
jgi:hypothetical protein